MKITYKPCMYRALIEKAEFCCEDMMEHGKYFFEYHPTESDIKKGGFIAAVGTKNNVYKKCCPFCGEKFEIEIESELQT